MREIRPETIPRQIRIREQHDGWMMIVNNIPVLLMDDIELAELWEAADAAMKDVYA